VNWHVLSHSITASKAQIAALSQVLHMNARPAQALNGRLLIAPAN
jgi:carbonic anhydrase